MAQNERKSTRFEGVHQRESRAKRHNGKPDVCYEIDYQDPTINKRVRKRIGWRSEGVTAEYARDIRSKLLHERKLEEATGGKILPMRKVPTFGEAFTLYKQNWLDVKNTSSAEVDESRFHNHLNGIANIPLNFITAATLDSLMAELARKGLSPQTVKHVIALVRRVMRKMVTWREYAGQLPFDQVTLPRVNNQRQRFLTPEEAHTLLEELQKHSPRMWIMSLISLHCGLRFSEVANLRWSDISYANSTLHIRDPKEARDRMAIMTPQVSSAIRDLPQGRGGELLFPTRGGTVMKEPSSAFERAVTRMGLNEGITDRRQKVVFHTLRHTFASWLAKAGNGQTVIADMLGHSSLEMSRRYTHLMPDTKKQAAASISTMFDSTHGNQQ